MFWFACHTRWIDDGVFGSDLRSIFTAGSDNPEQQVRNFLRRSSGLPFARGAASVITDCPVSRGWWRTEIANDVHATLAAERALSSNDHRAGTRHQVPDLTAGDCHRLLHPNGLWGRLVELYVSRVAAANAPRARAALVAALHQTDGAPATASAVQAAVVELGRLASGFSLHQCSWDRLVDAALTGLQSKR